MQIKSAARPRWVPLVSGPWNLKALVALFVWAPTLVFSADSPARLKDGEHSIEQQLHVPETIERGRYVVMCEAWVSKFGNARNFECYSSPRARQRSHAARDGLSCER